MNLSSTQLGRSYNLSHWSLNFLFDFYRVSPVSFSILPCELLALPCWGGGFMLFLTVVVLVRSFTAQRGSLKASVVAVNEPGDTYLFFIGCCHFQLAILFAYHWEDIRYCTLIFVLYRRGSIFTKLMVWSDLYKWPFYSWSSFGYKPPDSGVESCVIYCSQPQLLWLVHLVQ